MKSLNQAVASGSRFVEIPAQQAMSDAGIVEERLPFTLRVARSDAALQKAITIRQAAYARHVPEFAAKLGAPEENDYAPGSLVLIAESRMDGSPLGTMRIQTNRFKELAVERSVELPDWLRNRSMAEATRLGVAFGRSGRVVKTALFKALYFYCLNAGIDWLVIGARAPLDRMYEGLLFQDLYPGQFIPLRHFDNIPHRVLAFDVAGARASWEKAKHPLLNFMCYTHHPDIDLADVNSSLGDVPLHRVTQPAKAARFGLDNAIVSIRNTFQRAAELPGVAVVGA
ncbi:MAG: hypothetical protein IH606_07955 [Burkholderiales bacterium]|nr:hypothetical protein [Burkholderiales bacterium]